MSSISATSNAMRAAAPALSCPLIIAAVIGTVATAKASSGSIDGGCLGKAASADSKLMGSNSAEGDGQQIPNSGGLVESRGGPKCMHACDLLGMFETVTT